MKNKKKFFNFLILGSNGLLGKKISEILKQKNQSLLKIARSKSDFNIDLNNHKKLNNFLKKYKFKYVINCAAIINLNLCEKNKILATKTNYTLPKFLANISNKLNFKVIHISTDHVYCSKKNVLNSETDKIKAINFYAHTKIIAEKAVKIAKKYLIIRTNFVGKKNLKNPSFTDWVYFSSKNKKKVKLFDNMFTSTLDVNSCAKYIIKLALSNSRGIYNLGSKNQISKKDFALKFIEKLDLTLKYDSVTSNIYKVKRSNNLGLNIKKIEKKLNEKMPTVNKVINNLVKDYK